MDQYVTETVCDGVVVKVAVGNNLRSNVDGFILLIAGPIIWISIRDQLPGVEFELLRYDGLSLGRSVGGVLYGIDTVNVDTPRTQWSQCVSTMTCPELGLGLPQVVFSEKVTESVVIKYSRFDVYYQDGDSWVKRFT